MSESKPRKMLWDELMSTPEGRKTLSDGVNEAIAALREGGDEALYNHLHGTEGEPIPPQLKADLALTADDIAADLQNPTTWCCAKCGEGIEGKYRICWNCGERRELAANKRESHTDARVVSAPASNARRETGTAKRSVTPRFGMLEDASGAWDSKPTKREKFSANKVIVILYCLIIPTALAVLRLLFGSYALYAGLGIVAVFILWRVFRREAGEGRGLDLNR